MLRILVESCPVFQVSLPFLEASFALEYTRRGEDYPRYVSKYGKVHASEENRERGKKDREVG